MRNIRGCSSMILPLPDNSIAGSLGVPAEIHAEDYLYRFISEHPKLKDRAHEHYFKSARESAERVRALILGNRVPHGLAQLNPRDFSLLDFASGFGMVNRHFRSVMPEAKVEACDIHPKAVEFHRQYLGLACHLSSEDPRALGIDRRYDVVLALSFLSHIPERLWLPWLEALSARVDERGLLIFTTHGPSSAVSKADCLVEKGIEFSFAPHSEQLDLDRESYGTTYAHPRFAMDVLRRLPGMHLSEFKMGAWWGGNQDVYVLVRLSGEAGPVHPGPTPPTERLGWFARILGKSGPSRGAT
jgi:hypothetical protein